MSNEFFERRMGDFFKSNPHLVDLLKVHTNMNDFNKSYEFILGELLFSYGIISINIHGLSDVSKKYFPYIKFSDNNIFNEPEGFCYLFKMGFYIL
ncbi:hypothetical protein BPO_0384 [Bergeyella porcorum]|uniref:Uncharacterized protein n=1 Tax=Bergeyella porcorum TaxID=1735111 RepID=A0AAU0EZ11_9FLAO